MPKRSRSIAGNCVFCGRYGPLTHEDAVPAWLLKIIWPGGLSWGITGTALQENLRKAPTGCRLKVQALCADCNNNWLGPIEKRAKPKLMSWMTGIYSPLTVTDQKLLSLVRFWRQTCVIRAGKQGYGAKDAEWIAIWRRAAGGASA